MIVKFAAPLSRRDALGLVWLGLRAKPQVLLLGTAFFVVLPWAAAAGALLGWLGTDPVGFSKVLPLIAVPPLAVAGFAEIALRRTRNVLPGERTVEIKDDGIRVRGPGLDVVVEWRHVGSCWSSKSGLLVFSHSGVLLALPGSAIAPGARAELRQILNSKQIPVAGGAWRRAGLTT